MGWLTIELPGGNALLEPLNLYSAEALQRKHTHFGEKHRKNGLSKRVTVNGQSESSNQAWEVGGKYRLVERVVVHEEADVNSRIIGELRKGSLVTVRGLEHLSRLSEPPILRLQISNEHTDVLSWLSPLNANGEKLLDSRDHMEFEKLMRLQLQAQDQAEQDTAPEPPEQASPPPDPPAWVPPAPWDENQNPMGMESTPEATPEHYQPISPETLHSQVSSQMTKCDAPSIQLTYDNAKSGELQKRQDNKLNSGVARPWEHSGPGYRTLNEMDAGEDDRHVGDNIENEGFMSICACRNGLLNCSAAKLFPSLVTSSKVKSPSGPHPMSHGMMGEPAPEPRPMRQLPSPPGVHAMAMPN